MSDPRALQDKLRAQQEEAERVRGEGFRRALEDPHYRQVLLDQPRLLSASASEGSPEFRRVRKELLVAVLARADSDGEFRARLQTRPTQTMRDAGFGPHIERVRASLPHDVVANDPDVFDEIEKLLNDWGP